MDDDEQPDPTQEDDGKFIPEHLLLDWYRKMQQKYPQVFTPEESLFGPSDEGQHPYGTKLLAYFDDDPNKPIRCEVRGSRWKLESEFAGMADNREPVYVVYLDGEYSQIPLTSAHEEGGWQVEMDQDDDHDDDDGNDESD
jgi:hypothetical protein